jgi:hypothetical protein
LNNMFKNLAVWLVIGLVLMTVFNQFNNRQVPQSSMEYSQFIEEVGKGTIAKVVIEGRVLKATTTDGRKLTSYAPPDLWMVSDLLKYGVTIEAKPEEEQSFLMSIFVSWFPMLLLIGVWIFFMRQMQGGGRGGAFSFGKSKARLLDESTNTITFADVAGCDEAKEEVSELVDFLRDPSKFQKLGGRIPKGVLLVGNPGTGKTLLAKAIAGEAKVPFFSISGSDFVEMFVGVGAARVRDMFENAKKHAPCIIFIDELDAVGRQRGAGLGGGNDEREQTLNQMLVEMDGFEGSVGVIVIAATNRPDVLDPAADASRSFRPPGGRTAAGHPWPRADTDRAHAQGAAVARRQGGHHRPGNARLLRGRSRQSGQRGGPVCRPRQQAPGRHGGLRESQGQDHDGRRAPQHGHERGRAAQYGLPRIRSRGGRQADAEVGPGAQGHHHSARAGARLDHAASRGRSLRLRPGVPDESDCRSLWWPYRRRTVHEPDDYRRFE